MNVPLTSLILDSLATIGRPETSEVYKGPDFFIPLLVKTVADNGVLIMNLGPRADGTIPPEQESILRGVGAWLYVFSSVFQA
eukprot:m.762886 g.762886  ORF g.762886 m.762886 type:complete len:82 (+) comp23211_c0_seq18:1485-1730(+)